MRPAPVKCREVQKGERFYRTGETRGSGRSRRSDRAWPCCCWNPRGRRTRRPGLHGTLRTPVTADGLQEERRSRHEALPLFPLRRNGQDHRLRRRREPSLRLQCRCRARSAAIRPSGASILPNCPAAPSNHIVLRFTVSVRGNPSVAPAQMRIFRSFARTQTNSAVPSVKTPAFTTSSFPIPVWSPPMTSAPL